MTIELGHPSDLEWVCGYDQEHQEEAQAPSQGMPSHPEPQSKMQRKRTGPEAPRAGPRVKAWGNLAFEDA